MNKAGRWAGLMLLVGCALAQGGRESFGGDKYSLEFPDGWKKPAAADAKALIVRENADGSAMFAVNRMSLPEGAKADLGATAKALGEGFRKDLGLDKVPDSKEGEIDGLPARFLTVSKAPKEGEAKEPGLAFFVVLVEAKGEVVVMQATLALPAAKEVREQCLAVIKSFRRGQAP